LCLFVVVEVRINKVVTKLLGLSDLINPICG
jgi:hypothetical protein